MAFLNQSMIKNSEHQSMVDDHPLLKDGDIPVSVKQAYVEGCVLATLMDDEKVSDDERTAVYKIGRSLRLDNKEIESCFEVVIGLKDDDKEPFVDELLQTVKKRPVCLWFLNDFEVLLGLHGEISDENYQFLQHFGKTLMNGDSGWRDEVFDVLDSDVDKEKWFKRCKIAADRGILEAKVSVASAYLFGQGIVKDRNVGCEMIKKLAEQGEPHAQLCLSCCFMEDENMVEAFRWMRKSAEQNNADAQKFMGDFYRYGSAGEKNLEMAVEYYKKAVSRGNAEAQYALGSCYLSGEGISEDLAEAYNLIKLSADQGCLDAQGEMGFLYWQGIGVNANVKTAIEWYEKAAKKGHAFSQLQLGYAHLSGEDKYRAFNYFMKAAEQDVAEAQNMVGMCYKRGDGVNVDLKESVKWVRKAAENGDMYAQNNLADSYADGEGVAENVAESIKWRRKAADQGHVEALIGLAVCYYVGNGVPEDHAKAFELELQAAEKGDASAQVFVGNAYLNGDGVAENLYKANQWYAKAADQGDADGQNMLGMAYSNGRGVSVNKVEAFGYFQKAADQGCAAAQVNLGLALLDGDGCSQDQRAAFDWFGKAADQGNADGGILRARCYEEGWGVPQNNNEARRLYRELAQNGNAQAMRNLGVSLTVESNETLDEDVAREGLRWLKMALENGVEDAQEQIQNAWDPDVVTSRASEIIRELPRRGFLDSLLSSL